jgi:aldehyde dehydrogenase (NAD+)
MECNPPLSGQVNFVFRFYNQGQVCCATTRIYVHESIKEKFTKAFTEFTLSNKVGNPFDEDTYQGPQISKVQFDRVTEYIKLGQKEGAKLVIGEAPTSSDNGYFIQPHIFADVKPDMRVKPPPSPRTWVNIVSRFRGRKFSDRFV